MQLKKFKSIKELLLSKEFRNKDLSYCDLSSLNLRHLPSFTWNGFIFNHTNFSNTGIKFYPNKLLPLYKQYHNKPYYSIEYCDFTNCDLSYLTTADMTFVSIKGVNFTNTNLNIELTNSFGGNIKKSYEGLGFKDFSDVIFPQNEEMRETIKKIGFLCNCNTIINNPHIQFSSKDIFSILNKELPDKNAYITSESLEKFKNVINIMLEEDKKREGKLINFF